MKDTPLYHYRWPILGCLAVFILFISFCMDYVLSTSGNSILTTLAIIQASIFAIAFSVVILGVRLSATRYSPRLASTFRNDPAYRWTVGIFGVSIGLNIAGLYFIGNVDPWPLTVLTTISGLGAIGAFWTLYDFVNQTLEKTTPEGILSEIEKDLTPASIIEDAHASADDPRERDPFLVLISVIHSTISEQDRVSTFLGLVILRERIADLLENAPTEEFDENSPVDESLENVCVDQLPDLIEDAVEEDLTQSAIEVTETAEAIGEAAIENDVGRVIEHVIRGQSQVIDSLGFETSDERLRKEVMDKASDVLKSAAEDRVWRGAAVGARVMAWMAAASIMRRDEDQAFGRPYTSLLILTYPKLLNKACESDDEKSDHPISTWLRGQEMDVQPVELMIASCYGAMAELTSAAIRYEIRTEQRLLRWESIAFGWTDGFDGLTDTELVSIQELWYGTILYLEYLEFITPDDVMQNFNPRASFEADSEFAQATINKILDEELDPRPRVDFIPGSVDPIEMPLTGQKSPPVTDPETTFHEWLETRQGVRGSSVGFL